VMAREERISVLLTTPENFTRLKFYMEQIGFPVVGIEWL
jgi:hypothetical protein